MIRKRSEPEFAVVEIGDALRLCAELRARIATLEAALLPFADLADDYLSQCGDDDPLAFDDGTEVDEALFAGVTLGELRRARAAWVKP